LTTQLIGWEEGMRFLITVLAASLAVAFTFNLATARKVDKPNSGYDSSGQHYTGQVKPVPGTKPTTPAGKKNKSN
jgi:hypothetical protein